MLDNQPFVQLLAIITGGSVAQRGRHWPRNREVVGFKSLFVVSRCWDQCLDVRTRAKGLIPGTWGGGGGVGYTLKGTPREGVSPTGPMHENGVKS